jgi:sulfonate transport system substrate-binding protein
MKFTKVNGSSRFFTIGALLFILMFAVVGCGQKAPEVSEINISYVKSPLNVPSILEKQEGLFEEAFSADKITIGWPELTTGPAQTQAMAAGDLDFAHGIGSTSVLIAAAEGLDLKIIGIYSRGAKAFMMLTKDDSIQSPADLVGKRIGGPKGTVLHQLLIAALKSQGLTDQDVEFTSMDIPATAAALESGAIDVGLLAGPAALQAMTGGARMVVNGDGLVDGTIMTAVTKAYYEDHKDIVDRFMKVHNDAVQYIADHHDEVIALTAKEVGLSVEQTEALFAWYDFDSTIRQSDLEEMERTQEFLLQTGLQTNKIEVTSLVP